MTTITIECKDEDLQMFYMPLTIESQNVNESKILLSDESGLKVDLDINFNSNANLEVPLDLHFQENMEYYYY